MAILRGDANGDGLVDVADLGILAGQWGTAGPEADFDLDGAVDVADLGILAANWTGSGGGGAGAMTTVPLPRAMFVGILLYAALACRRPVTAARAGRRR